MFQVIDHPHPIEFIFLNLTNIYLIWLLNFINWCVWSIQIWSKFHFSHNENTFFSLMTFLSLKKFGLLILCYSVMYFPLCHPFTVICSILYILYNLGISPLQSKYFLNALSIFCRLIVYVILWLSSTYHVKFLTHCTLYFV